MAGTFLLHIDTPEKKFFEGQAEKLIIFTTDGEIGVLPGHLSMVVAMVTAPARILINGEWRMAAIFGGFARIKPEEVFILADSAQWPEDIEEARAEEARKLAAEQIQQHISEIEYVRSRIALERALTRLIVKHSRG